MGKPLYQRLSEPETICPEALPCPFCGSPATIQYWHGGKPTKRMIRCSDSLPGAICWVGPGVTGETKSEAIRRWNRRRP